MVRAIALDDLLLTRDLLFADVRVEPHKKQLHVTLAYHFQASHLPTLEKLAQSIEVKLGCDWVAAIFSRDIRFANHEVRFGPENSLKQEASGPMTLQVWSWC